MLSFLVLCGWIVGASKGFLFENTPVPANMFPGLPEIAKKQTGLALDVRIIVENPSDQQSMMALDGLSLALSGDEIRTSQNDRGDDDKAFSLPGDRTPHLRSGRHAVRVESSPGFVGMNGHQKVDVSNHGGWELVWKEGDLTGNLICGICVNEEVRERILCIANRRYTYWGNVSDSKLIVSPLFPLSAFILACNLRIFALCRLNATRTAPSCQSEPSI